MRGACRIAKRMSRECFLADVPTRNGVPCKCTWEAATLSVKPDHSTLGVVVLYSKGAVADWVDVVVTDLALDSLTQARLRRLEAELGAPLEELEIARRTYSRGHAEVPGSSSFTLIRLSAVGVSPS